MLVQTSLPRPRFSTTSAKGEVAYVVIESRNSVGLVWGTRDEEKLIPNEMESATTPSIKVILVIYLWMVALRATAKP